MKVSVGQIYIKPGVSFPFSHIMQLWLGEETTSAAEQCTDFVKKYGPKMDLIVRLSADTGIAENRIKGPTIFKKGNDVEYTLFLPFDVIKKSAMPRRAAAEFIVSGVRSIFEEAGIDREKIDEKAGALIEHLSSDPTMLSKPWPESDR